MNKLTLTIPLLALVLIATGCVTSNKNDDANTNAAADTSFVTTASADAEQVDGQDDSTETAMEDSKSTDSMEVGGDVAGEVTVTETSPEVDAYEGWETYTNEEYGFSFRYPSDWELSVVNEIGLDTDIGDVILKKENCLIHTSIPGADLTEEQKSRALSAFQVGQETGQYFNNEDVEVLAINSVPVLKYISTINESGDIGVVYKLLIEDQIVTYLLRYGTQAPACVEVSDSIINSLYLRS